MDHGNEFDGVEKFAGVVRLDEGQLRSHVAGTKWGTRRYLDMDRLGLPVPVMPTEAVAAVG